MEKLSLQVLSLEEMEKIEGAGSCASGGVQAGLLLGTAVLGFFNPLIWGAGTAYFVYCHGQG